MCILERDNIASIWSRVTYLALPLAAAQNLERQAPGDKPPSSISIGFRWDFSVGDKPPQFLGVDATKKTTLAMGCR
jgi:hypothetical protein